MTSTSTGHYGSFGYLPVSVNQMAELRQARNKVIATEKADKAATIAKLKAQNAFETASVNLQKAVDTYVNATDKKTARAALIKTAAEFPKVTSLSHDFLLTFHQFGTIDDPEINKAFQPFYAKARKDVYGDMESTEQFYNIMRNNVDRHNRKGGCDICHTNRS